MELDEAFSQIEKLEQQVEVAQKIGEQLHTQMEIRENPYEDIEGIGDAANDRSVDIGDVPYGGGLEVNLSKKRDASPLGLKLPSGDNPNSVETLGNMLASNKLDKKPSISNARQKLKIAKLGVPSLDLSGLKNVKEYKDWYGYSQKLENCIGLLRERAEALEKERDM